MSDNTDTERQNASFRQRHPYVDAFIEGLPRTKIFILYWGVGLALTFVGVTMVAVFSEHGATDADVDGLLLATKIAGLTYMTGLPVLFGIGTAALRWFEYNRGEE
jgi:hypothetical protein